MVQTEIQHSNMIKAVSDHPNQIRLLPFDLSICTPQAVRLVRIGAGAIFVSSFKKLHQPCSKTHGGVGICFSCETTKEGR